MRCGYLYVESDFYSCFVDYLDVDLVQCTISVTHCWRDVTSLGDQQIISKYFSIDNLIQNCSIIEIEMLSKEGKIVNDFRWSENVNEYLLPDIQTKIKCYQLNSFTNSVDTQMTAWKTGINGWKGQVCFSVWD